jgi:mRNA interferase MazF
MKKDFDRWNDKKKAVHDRRDTERLFFRAHEIWWAHLGVNVGYEQDGTGPDFERPVVS